MGVRGLPIQYIYKRIIMDWRVDSPPSNKLRYKGDG